MWYNQRVTYFFNVMGRLLHMKKLIALILSLMIVFGLSSAQAYTVNVGVLSFNAASEDEFEQIFLEHWGAHHQDEHEYTLTYYDNMNSMLMALQARDIFMMITNSSVANYMVARNDALAILPGVEGEGLELSSVSYTMILRQDAADLQAKLSDAILALKDDGSLDALIETSLKAYIASCDPEPVALPVYEGAPTITVAVTGDQPPMDFVAVDGAAAGFNVSLLAAIAEKAQLNIELITVDTSARLAALSSGRADVVFWSSANTCEEHPDFDRHADIPEGVLTTEPYFTDSMSMVMLAESAKYVAHAE